ncbi:MAG: cbb3-type cytochrome c oxidase subunit I, partial [Opitutaceae bacterium]
MTTAPQAAETAEVTEIDTTARWPLLLLLGFALVWLVVSGLLSLVNLVQVHTPGFLADCPLFTYGRTQAMQESALIYGWAVNAGLAAGLWILARLGGSPLRSLNWTVAGALFWNLALALGLVGIATGDGLVHAWFHLPGYVLPIMLLAYGAIAVPGVLAWTGRRHQMTFAAQWYAVAALFLFPWIFSAAQMMLVFAPARGVLQAVIANWFMQGAWTFLLAPLALASAYYLVPKISGRVIPSYEFAIHSFWILLVFGGWTGARHLVGGPVPVWIPSLAVVTSVVLLFHYLVVALNLRGAFGGSGVVLKFIAFGLSAYVVGGLVDAATAMRSVAVITQFTFFSVAQVHLALDGALSMMLLAAVYFMVPRITGRAWPSGAMVRAHLVAAAIGFVGLVVTLAVAGLIQGHDLANPAVSFADIAAHVRPWLLAATAAQAVWLFG